MSLSLYCPSKIRVGSKYLVWREEYGAVRALDALGAGRVVPSRDELTAAAPGAVVQDLKREAFREPRRGVVAEEALAESLSLTPCDHSTSSKHHQFQLVY